MWRRVRLCGTCVGRGLVALGVGGEGAGGEMDPIGDQRRQSDYNLLPSFIFIFDIAGFTCFLEGEFFFNHHGNPETCCEEPSNGTVDEKKESTPDFQQGIKNVNEQTTQVNESLYARARIDCNCQR